MDSPAASSFVTIHLDQMRACLLGIDSGFEERPWPGARERVFWLSSLNHPGVCVCVFTSIEGEWSRGSGRDALRVALVDERSNKFVGSQTHTKRLVGWERRLESKILNLCAGISQYECPRGCGGYLTERKGLYGKFFGCTNYPVCCATRPLPAQHTPRSRGADDYSWDELCLLFGEE